MVNHTQNIRRKDVNPIFQVLYSPVDETVPPIFQIFSNIHTHHRNYKPNEYHPRKYSTL